MNKTFKGCLISIVTIILIFTVSIVLIGNHINKSFRSDKNKVDESWKKYIKLLRNRNNILVNDSNAKSLKPIIFKTYDFIKNNNKKDLLANEYIY
jgi:hypothetical protein